MILLGLEVFVIYVTFHGKPLCISQTYAILPLLCLTFTLHILL